MASLKLQKKKKIDKKEIHQVYRVYINYIIFIDRFFFIILLFIFFTKTTHANIRFIFYYIRKSIKYTWKINESKSSQVEAINEHGLFPLRDSF